MAHKPFGPQDQLQIASLGTEFALYEIIGTALGYFLDRKCGTLPWCTVAGVLAGFALGLERVIQSARQANRAGKKDGRS